ncbi:MAG: hypothetical protein ACRD0J_02850, partial [Acidimicrobiales bacterium]
GPVVNLLPLDGVANVGIEVDQEGVGWAAPLQVVIDCYGGGGRLPEQADAIAERVFGWEIQDA